MAFLAAALTTLKEKLSERGLKVFVVPEVPTLTMEGGGMIIMGGLSSENVCRFQSLLMKAQMNFEDYFNDLALLNGKPAVILMDRGKLTNDPTGMWLTSSFPPAGRCDGPSWIHGRQHVVDCA